MATNPIYIPTFIGSITYAPVRVLPHIYFYNGLKDTNTFYIGGYGATTSSLNIASQSAFPYFDNYSGNTPTTESLSLLFNNETAAYGEIPTASLYTTYWEKYINLLYNPRTRLLNASAIIPLADYFEMELNDIVNFRGNYWHLRAINDYSLQTGECTIQLLGPIIGDTLSQSEFPCYFDFSVVNYTPGTTTTTTAGPTTTTTTATPTTTTTTAAPTLYYTGVDCCGGGLTCKISVAPGLAGGQPTPFPYGVYVPGKGCFNITALSTAGPVDFAFTTYGQQQSYWYGESLCSFCVSTYGCPTTTTTAGPTTTTTAGPTTTTTTTTTVAPTTTTTTVQPPIGGYYYYAVANNCCTNTPSQNIVGVVAVTSSLGILIDGQTLGNNDYTSSTGTHCVSVKYVTSSVTPLLFTIEQSQANTNTYGLDQCNSCNRDFIPTPASGVCLDYDLVNAEATLTYVSCSGTPTSASMSGGTFEFCSRTTPVITYTSNKADARLAVACTNCGTYTTTTTLAP